MEKKRRVGRPNAEIDWEQAEKMAQIHCTGEEIALLLGVDYDTLEKAVKKRKYKNFSDWYKKHASQGKRSLRRKQFEQALGGNTAMLIWLGKNFLDQKDQSVERTELRETSKVVIYETQWGNQSETVDKGDE